MTYALKLDDDGRILSSTYGKYAIGPGYTLVEKLPEGDITDYCFVEREFVHDPKPKEKVEEPGATLESRVADLEADSTDMKEALEMILSGVTE